MAITFQILGKPGRDNAVLVRVDSGQSVERLLFDCGEDCLTDLPFTDVQSIDQLFLSHLHMDHIGGFDHFFRATYDRPAKPNHSWGPPQTAAILQRRFQGYLWNLHDEMSGSWEVTEIFPSELVTRRYELAEAYAVAHDAGVRPYSHTILEKEIYRIEALTLDHRTPSIGYIIREPSRRNIDTIKMAELGLKPGPWLKLVKDAAFTAGEVDVGGSKRSLAEVRELLMTESPGDSFAYLTDFLLDDAALAHVAERLQGCRVVICDGQYRHADLVLAHKNYHMTTVLSATLAQRAKIGELVLFHLCDRSEPAEWHQMLSEARQVFPNTRFPLEWQF
jgi:ribonuclease Z